MGGAIPLPISDISNPLTPFWLLVTIFFETGLGIGTTFVYLKVIPFLRGRASLLEVPGGVEVSNPVARLIVGRIIHKVPNRWWIRLLFLRGLAFVILFTVLLQLLTSVGWKSPNSWDNLVYDYLYANSNGEPNGAHLMSYLPIIAVAFYAMWVFKDEFFGLLMAFFIVAVHELPWVILYYSAYWQYLDFDLSTNVLKDVSFIIGICILPIYTFWKYDRMKLRQFLGPIVVYLIFLAGWYFIPSFFGYHIFPITTINNFKYGKGIYSETDYWNNPTVNGIEVFSWNLVALGSLAILILYSRWLEHGRIHK